MEIQDKKVLPGADHDVYLAPYITSMTVSIQVTEFVG